MSSQSTGDGNAADHRHLQAGDRPRQGPGAGPGPGHHSHTAPAARGAADRHHGAQELARRAPGGAHVLARQVPRSGLCRQLRHPADRAAAVAGARAWATSPSRAARDYAIRIWIDPDKAAARNLTVDDIVAALRSHNVQVSAGNIGAPPFGKAPSILSAADPGRGAAGLRRQQFADIVVKRDDQNRHHPGLRRGPGRPGRGELHHQRLPGLSEQDGKPETIAPGRRHRHPAAARHQCAEAAADGVIKEMSDPEEVASRRGSTTRSSTTPPTTSQQSIEEVYKTLGEALVLVVDRGHRLPAELAGGAHPDPGHPGLAGRHLRGDAGDAGFTLNNLSLFGLVLAIGIVVDDAIVVVENVDRHLEAWRCPRPRPPTPPSTRSAAP